MVRIKQQTQSSEALASQKKPILRHGKTFKSFELKDNLKKTQLKKLCRRAGVKRISADAYDTLRSGAHAYLRQTAGDALAIKDHKKKVEMTPSDVTFAVRIKGRTIYGIANRPRHSSKHSKKGRKSKRLSETGVSAE